MNWRLTAEERRIIARTQREGEQAHTSADGNQPGNAGTPTPAEVPLWRSIMIWIGGIALFVLLALLMVWIGSLFG